MDASLLFKLKSSKIDANKENALIGGGGGWDFFIWLRLVSFFLDSVYTLQMRINAYQSGTQRGLTTTLTSFWRLDSCPFSSSEDAASRSFLFRDFFESEVKC